MVQNDLNVESCHTYYIYKKKIDVWENPRFIEWIYYRPRKNLWKMTVTKGAQCTLNGDLWDNFLQCIFNTSNYFFKKSNLIRLFDGLFPILLQFWNQISQYISSCCAAGQGKDKAKTKIYAVLYLLIITM